MEQMYPTVTRQDDGAWGRCTPRQHGRITGQGTKYPKAARLAIKAGERVP